MAPVTILHGPKFKFFCIPRGNKHNCQNMVTPLTIVEAVTVRPITDWNQVPFFAWGFFRTRSNFLVNSIQNFRPPSWFLDAIFDFSTRKRSDNKIYMIEDTENFIEHVWCKIKFYIFFVLCTFFVKFTVFDILSFFEFLGTFF